MHNHIKKLYEIALKENRLIIGLMSGTSLDGLDVALCRFSGSGLDTQIELVQFETIAYNHSFKAEVKSIFSKRSVDFEKVCLLNGWIAIHHADLIRQCLNRWKLSAADVDLIASHGQTVYHAPYVLHRLSEFGNGTLQLGDGDHMAFHTG
ncbi:MAG: anhydro-N-acetylmuramic acid kinase, partial [Chitinophagaceae bacterium]|nr:anhydro-N-acetylmuramic acid kinase [Chitinophagaceae bacterium]